MTAQTNLPDPSPPISSATLVRRPIKARNSRWAAAFARRLAQAGITPNAISIGSIACGGLAGAALIGTRYTTVPWGQLLLFALAIVGIQCRLLCNLFDGMVAVEGGRAGPAGEVFNDLPDRLADPLILVSAGYAAGGPVGIALGWLAACLAILTAYVRVLGRSLGTGIYFVGPMAKQHRMAVMTAACAACGLAVFWRVQHFVLLAALGVICIGAALTVVRRTRLITRDLKQR